jgi:hypothetical protein
MKQLRPQGDKSLESIKIFPYVAWILTAGFAFFVYNITMELKDVTTKLQAQTDALEEKINTPVGSIESFE